MSGRIDTMAQKLRAARATRECARERKTQSSTEQVFWRVVELHLIEATAKGGLHDW